MKMFYIVLFIVLASFVGGVMLFAQNPKPQMLAKMLGGKAKNLNKPVTMPFELYNRHIIKVIPDFDGVKLTCVFDTGGMTFIDDDMVEKFDKNKIFEDQHMPKMIELSSLNMNGVEVNNFKAMVTNLGKMSTDEGMIGSSFLRFFNTTINYKNKTLTFANIKKLSKNNENETIHKMNIRLPYFPCIDIKVNGKTMNALVDTGAISSFVFPINMYDELPESEKQKCLKAKQIFGKWPYTNRHENYYYLMPEIKIGELVLKNTPVMFAGLPDMGNNANVLLGKNFLENYITELNYKHEQVKFTENKFLERDFNFSFGLDLIAGKSKIIVHGIWEKSAADKAGITSKTEILKVNGKTCNEITNEEIQEILANPKIKQMQLTLQQNEEVIEVVLNKQNLL